MKNSGIPWIGEIPEGWNLVQGKRLFISRKRIVGDDVEKYERLALTMNGVIKRNKDDNEGLQPEQFEGYQILRKNELVFKLIDLQNVKTSRVGLSPYEGIVSPAYITLQNASKDNRFYYYWYMFLYHYQVYNKLAGDGVRSALNVDDLLQIPIPEIPLSEQQAIADFLDKKCAEIDQMVALQEKFIEELKAYKQSLITETVTKGLNPNAPMKDSGVEWIGEIPAAWDIIFNRYLFKENVRAPRVNDIPLSLSQADGLIATDEMKENSLKTSTYEGWKSVRIDDIVLNRFKAHLGVLFCARIEGIVSFHYGVYESIRLLCSKYYEYLFHSNNYKYIYAQMSNGMVVGLQNLSNTNFYRVPSLFPPLIEQQAIADYLDKKCVEIDQLIAVKQKKADELKEYKKSIIYEYVTGKRSVCE